MAKLPNVSELTECPHCGSETFYYKSRVSGIVATHVNFDGSEVDNSGMHDGMSYESLKFAYCSQCQRKIARYKDRINANE